MTKLPAGLEKLAQFDEKAADKFLHEHYIQGSANYRTHDTDFSGNFFIDGARWQHARTKAEVLDVLQRAEKLAAVLEHAIELGYLGEGSTHGWGIQELSDWQAWKESK